MQNGIYHVRFSSQSGDHGEGLAVVKDGAINGGDTGYLYTGRLHTEGHAVTGNIEVRRWNTARQSVFGPVNQFTLDLAGTFAAEAKSFSVSGAMSGHPGQRITIQGRYLAVPA